jgi:hypothetical protein
MSSPPVDVKVSWLLDNCESMSRDFLICMPSRRLQLEDLCMVIDWRDVGEEEDVTPEATERGLVTVFGMPQLQDVLRSLRQQIASPTHELQLTALNYYLEHDAFIQLD